MQIFVENIEDDIFFLIFISIFLFVFRGLFLYLKLISCILLSYSVFAISMLMINVDSEELKFSCNKHSNVFLRFYHK